MLLKHRKHHASLNQPIPCIVPSDTLLELVRSCASEHVVLPAPPKPPPTPPARIEPEADPEADIPSPRSRRSTGGRKTLRALHGSIRRGTVSAPLPPPSPRSTPTAEVLAERKRSLARKASFVVAAHQSRAARISLDSSTAGLRRSIALEESVVDPTEVLSNEMLYGERGKTVRTVAEALGLPNAAAVERYLNPPQKSYREKQAGSSVCVPRGAVVVGVRHEEEEEVAEGAFPALHMKEVVEVAFPSVRQPRKRRLLKKARTYTSHTGRRERVWRHARKGLHSPKPPSSSGGGGGWSRCTSSRGSLWSEGASKTPATSVAGEIEWDGSDWGS